MKNNYSFNRVAVVADLHLGHGNILKHCARVDFMNTYERDIVESGDSEAIRRLRISPETVERMDEAFINSCNRAAGRGDMLIVVGDFCMIHKGESDDQVFDRYSRYVSRLQCRNVLLIWGNHDPKVYAPRLRQRVSSLFMDTCDKATTRIQGTKVNLIHEAPAIWYGRHHGVWCLYGHSHGHAEGWLESIMPGRFAIDVGIDHAKMILGEYRPFDWSEIVEYMSKRTGFGLLRDRSEE